MDSALGEYWQIVVGYLFVMSSFALQMLSGARVLRTRSALVRRLRAIGTPDEAMANRIGLVTSDSLARVTEVVPLAAQDQEAARLCSKLNEDLRFQRLSWNWTYIVAIVSLILIGHWLLTLPGPLRLNPVVLYH